MLATQDTAPAAIRAQGIPCPRGAADKGQGVAARHPVAGHLASGHRPRSPGMCRPDDRYAANPPAMLQPPWRRRHFQRSRVRRIKARRLRILESRSLEFLSLFAAYCSSVPTYAASALNSSDVRRLTPAEFL